MSKPLAAFERLVRATSSLGVTSDMSSNEVHPFEERNIHPSIALTSIKLFDDGHYSQATFEAFKWAPPFTSRQMGAGMIHC